MSNSLALQQAEIISKRCMSILMAGTSVFVLREDGTFEPSKDEAATRTKAAQAKKLHDNYRALIEGPHSRFWHMEVHRNWKLYLTGKAKPSTFNR